MNRLTVVVVLFFVSLVAQAVGNSTAYEKAMKGAVNDTACEYTGIGCGQYKAPPSGSSRYQPRGATPAVTEQLHRQRRLDKCQYYERYVSDGFPAGGPTQKLQVCFSLWGSVYASMLAVGQFTALESELLSGDDPWRITDRVPFTQQGEKDSSCILAIGVPKSESPTEPVADDSTVTMNDLAVRIYCRNSAQAVTFSLSQFQSRGQSSDGGQFVRAVIPALDRAFRREIEAVISGSGTRRK